MELNKIKELPLFLKLGKLGKKRPEKKKVNFLVASKAYGTETYKKLNFHKPIIF